MAILEIRNVTHRFASLKAVNDVSLSIEAGEFFTLLGPSVHTRDPAQWDEATRLILRAKPCRATFSNSTYIKDLAIGTIWVAHGYSGDMYRARQDARSANAADLSDLIGAGNPAIFPSPAQMLRDPDPATRRALSRRWTEIKVR